MTTQSLVNGKASDQINILDRGLLYGDGVFETIAVRDRRIFLWHEHMQRLQSACEVLGFSFPGAALLEDEVAKLQEVLKGFRTTDKQRGLLQAALKKYDGTHPFHNFTEIFVVNKLSIKVWPL